MGRIGRKISERARRIYDEFSTPRIRRYTYKVKNLQRSAKPSYDKSVAEGREDFRKLFAGARKRMRKEVRGARGKSNDS